MNRYFFTVFIIILFSTACMAKSNKMESQIAKLSEKLAASYRKGKDINFKKNIAIMDFENKSSESEKNSIGEAISELLVSQFSNSTIFRVVERKGLNAVLKEQELQMSGITDTDTAVKYGKILNADALIYGSVTELGDDFNITVKLIDVETGVIVAETISVPKSDLLETRDFLLDMAYVQKMGVGISINFMGHTMCGNSSSPLPFMSEEKTGFTRNIGVEFKYRVTKNFMFGMGANWVYGQVKYFDSMKYDTDDNPSNGLEGEDPFYIEAAGLTIPLNLYAVFNPTRRVNLFLYGGPEIYILNFSGYFIPSNGEGFGLNETGPEIHGETIGYSGGAGVEFFITPRLAFSIKTGYSYAVMEINTGSGNEHLGIDDTTKINLSGFTYMPSISFFF